MAEYRMMIHHFELPALPALPSAHGASCLVDQNPLRRLEPRTATAWSSRCHKLSLSRIDRNARNRLQKVKQIEDLRLFLQCNRTSSSRPVALGGATCLFSTISTSRIGVSQVFPEAILHIFQTDRPLSTSHTVGTHPLIGCSRRHIRQGSTGQSGVAAAYVKDRGALEELGGMPRPT